MLGKADGNLVGVNDGADEAVIDGWLVGLLIRLGPDDGISLG